MASLEILNLGKIGIEELPADRVLMALPSLKTLYLHYNALVDISALTTLDSLETVNLTLNPLDCADEAVLGVLATLREKGVTVLSDCD